jgi:hypothetical protein
MTRTAFVPGYDPAKEMSEKELLQSVIELAHLYGWLVFHQLPATNRAGKWASFTQGDTGFSDLVLAKGGRVIFAELKSEAGTLSLAQLRVEGRQSGLVSLEARQIGLSGEIERILKEG